MSEQHSHSSAATGVTDAGHSAGHGHDDLHLDRVWKVGAALLFCTLLTVALSYWDVGHEKNMILGMLLATFKVSLVCAYFMHLKGEKKLIWQFLYFTAFFAAGLFLLTAFAWVNPIFGTERNRHGNERALSGFERSHKAH